MLRTTSKLLTIFHIFIFNQLYGIVDFEKEILPILEERCIECHKAKYVLNGKIKEPKAGLRLDGVSHIMRGSDDGPVVVVDHPSRSSLYQRVILSSSDNDLMPPKGDPLSFTEQELIRKWIAQGLDFGSWVGAKDSLSDESDNLRKKEVYVPKYLSFFDKLSEGTALVPKELINKLNQNESFLVRPIGIGNSLIEVRSVANQEEISNDMISKLLIISENIAILDLRNSPVGDNFGKLLKKFPRLVNLNLSGTKISDALIPNLKEIKHLKSLNLSQTNLTEKSVKDLNALTQLESLYLWETEISEKSIDAIQKNFSKTQ